MKNLGIAQQSAKGIVKAVEKPGNAPIPEEFRFEGATHMTNISESTSTGEGLPVYLHIYDFSHEARVEQLNSLLSPRRCPLKLGGFFHVGIEVIGQEWSFGSSMFGSGVFGLVPRTHSSHHFRA